MIFLWKMVPSILFFSISCFNTGIAVAGINEWTSFLPPSAEIDYYVLDPTLESNMYGIYVVESVKFIRSTDSGFSWQPMRLSEDDSEQPASIAGTNDDPFVLYASTYETIENDRIGHLYRSLDRGTTWQRIYSSPNREQISMLHVSPCDPSIIFALSSKGHEEYSVIRSSDGGFSWTVTKDNYFGISFAFTHADPDRVYAIDAEYEKIIRSSDSGQTWIELSSPGPYQKFIAASQSDPDRVYLISAYNAMKSTDGGQSWIEMIEDDFYCGSVSGGLYVNPLNDKEVLIKGDHCGALIWKSTDGGDSWQIKAELSGSQFLHVYFRYREQYPESVYLNGCGIRKSTDGGETWVGLVPASRDTADGGRGRQGFVHPDDSSYYYFVIEGVGCFKSTNSGQTWASCGWGMSKWNTYGNYAFDAVDHDIVYLAMQNAVFGSWDRGNTWKKLRETPLDSKVNFNVYASPSQPGRLLLRHYDTETDLVPLWISDDYGTNWQERTPPGCVFITRMVEEFEDPQSVFVLGDKEWWGKLVLFSTKDGGETWTEVGEENGLDDMANSRIAASLVINPHNHGEMFIGGEKRLFYSSDYGQNWVIYDEWKYGFEYFQIDPFYANVFYSERRSADFGMHWSPIECATFDRDIGFVNNQPDFLFSSDCKVMQVVEDYRPTIYMAGYGISFLEQDRVSDLQILVVSDDTDVSDFVSEVDMYYEDSYSGLSVYPNNSSQALCEDNMLSYRIMRVNVPESGRFRFDFQAKDLFGNLSEKWPYLTVH